MLIRNEMPNDTDNIRRLNVEAFGSDNEADIVEAIGSSGVERISLVAEVGGKVLGHILFTPVAIEPDCPARIIGLAPMAVAPAHQRGGIGSALVKEGLRRCREAGYDGVVVLGYPEYYPRFGFVPARKFGINCTYDVPPEVFMALELKKDSLAGCSGVVRYHGAFGQ